ncbi:hypothetical protein AB3S75_032174 [Citrus x aurantiifolia]
MRIPNPRRGSFSNTQQNPDNPFNVQNLSTVSILLNFLKRPQAFPFLLSIFVLLTWLSLRLQHSSSQFELNKNNHEKWSSTKDDDVKANLVRFKSDHLPSLILKDRRGWLLNPISLAIDAGVKGGAVSCVSLHVGEIQPGALRGNHRHYTLNETFVIWGAKTKFRLENKQIDDKGYAEVIVGADEVAIAASPQGTAHALVNTDLIHSTFFIGCQDGVINNNASTSDFNVWKDL